MTRLLTAAEMREIENAAIETGEVTAIELMERAALGARDAIFSEWPELARGGHEAIVLCGPGNNGGDGFALARLLRDAQWAVTVYLEGEPGRLPPDAKENHDRWQGMGSVVPLAQLDVARLRDRGQPALWVDALFGTGLTRPVEPAVAEALGEVASAVNLSGGRAPARIVALDMPSGLDGDSGQIRANPDAEEDDEWEPFQPLCCDLTVAFHQLKPGHVLALGPFFCGRVVTVDIGLGEGTAGVPLLTRERVASMQKRAGHKYDHGHALILSGGVGRGGAARMASRCALRAGAGLVTLGCPPAAVIENAAHLDAIMIRPVADVAALGELLSDRRLRAIGLGPGLGTNSRAAELVACALEARRKTVLDADALTLVGGDAALFARLHEDCVLTPHGGEFARLFPEISEMLSRSAGKGPAFSKIDATRAAAESAGCTVLFKGPDTVVAAPGGEVLVSAAAYERAVPWLATAGAGDALAGIITGLLARGFTPMQAAGAATWLHVECALSFGPGLIAEDLADQIPAVFRTMSI